MTRKTHAGGPFVKPWKSDGTQTEAEGPRGHYTLALSTTYYFPLGGPDAPIVSAHLKWDASIVITSITLEDCNLPGRLGDNTNEVPDFSTTAGEWIDEDPSTAFVGTVGAGVTVTNGVVAVAGGAAGGCMYHIADTGAARSRMKVVVGGTGGVLCVACHGKE